ncbi:MAG: hypothetical protein JXA99_12160, partial [Candidatus Lokiarchaeota archaeon]|nr:hypothetical protein [Candidatus Lokiarchaeota archaeon]
EMWKDFTNDDTKFLNYSEGWYGTDEPYQVAISSIVSVAFNHEYGTPLNESWFRDAIGYMINYDPIPDAAASGYTRRACATFIDNVSSTQMIYYNETLDAAYRRSYNPSQAAAILTAHGCTGTVGGTWTLPDGVTTIGPFTMICPAGWGDVRVFSEYVCDDISDFGIEVTFDGIDVDTIGWAAWTALWTTRSYTLGMSCGTPKVVETPEVFFNGWRAFKDWNNNITGWNTAKAWEYDALYKQLETENDPVRYQYLLDEIQRIFCEETPELPCFINGYWYTTSSYYWDGWCNANNEYQQIVTEWTNDAIPMKTRLILNLVSTGRDPPPSEGIPWTGLELFMILGLVSTIVLAGYKIYRKKR